MTTPMERALAYRNKKKPEKPAVSDEEIEVAPVPGGAGPDIGITNLPPSCHAVPCSGGAEAVGHRSQGGDMSASDLTALRALVEAALAIRTNQVMLVGADDSDEATDVTDAQAMALFVALLDALPVAQAALERVENLVAEKAQLRLCADNLKRQLMGQEARLARLEEALRAILAMAKRADRSDQLGEGLRENLSQAIIDCEAALEGRDG